MILSVLGFVLCGWFLVSAPVVREDAWYDFNFLEFVDASFVSYHVVHLWISPWTLEKNVYFASLGWKALYISVNSISSRVILNDTLSFFIFCLEDLSFLDSGLLNSPTIIVLLSISFLKSLKIFFMYLGAPMLGEYILTMFMSSRWILPLSIMKWPSGSLFMALFWKSVLSDMSIATPAFFFLFVCLENLFPALHFQSV